MLFTQLERKIIRGSNHSSCEQKLHLIESSEIHHQTLNIEDTTHTFIHNFLLNLASFIKLNKYSKGCGRKQENLVSFAHYSSVPPLFYSIDIDTLEVELEYI